MAAPLSCDVDVVVLGGGPAGTTVASLLRKYDPDLSVLILEKERFPRDHIGESQLPSISNILDEMGVWDQVEAAGFPIKIGGSLTWGRETGEWDFDFYPVEEWKDEPRPARFEGQRRQTAFQVDRSVYDKILLDHAESLGATVRQETRVDRILVDADRVEGFELATGETVTGRYYIDASGAVALVRRALGVASWAPKELRNIAIWDYWRNAEWAVEIGVGATRIQIRSLPFGWVWFIPLSPTRTSIGLICPAEHYKRMGKSPEALYREALALEPKISRLTAKATREGKLQSCKDWSHLAERLVGENWFIVGEAAGFADPILSAGMTLAHSSAREAAYTILELDRDELDPAWLRERFEKRNRTNIAQHIRFAQFWYSSNGCFTDLREQCSRIAAEAGLRLTPHQAWRWLSQGGFTSELLGTPALGGVDVSTAKQLISHFDERGREASYSANGYNVFKLNLAGATETMVGHLHRGRIKPIKAFERGGRTLPNAGYYALVIKCLSQTSELEELVRLIETEVSKGASKGGPQPRALLQLRFSQTLQALDTMIDEYWVTPSVDKRKGVLHVSNTGSRYIRSSDEARRIIAEQGGDTPVTYAD